MTTTLKLVSDSGTSTSKNLYKIGERGKIKHLTLGAEVLELPLSSIVNSSLFSSFSKPEDSAIVQIDNSDSCYLVGVLAREYRASTSVEKLKYELIIPKILATVGIIATLNSLPEQFDLELGLLLPYGEFKSSVELEKLLTEALKEFKFKDNTYQINLTVYSCYPEGYGIAMAYNQHSPEELSCQTVAYCMFGYRNTSILTLKNGGISFGSSTTTQLGFYNLIDLIVRNASGITRDEVQSAIYTYKERCINDLGLGADRYCTKIMIEDLIKSNNPLLAAIERKQLEEALEIATQQYWQLLKNWLLEVLLPSNQLNRLVIAGGAAVFFESFLLEYLKDNYPKSIIEESLFLEQEFLSALALNESEQKIFERENLPLRFVDAWGIFSKLVKYRKTGNNKAIAL